jgi:hypothetical protein
VYPHPLPIAGENAVRKLFTLVGGVHIELNKTDIPERFSDGAAGFISRCGFERCSTTGKSV